MAAQSEAQARAWAAGAFTLPMTDSGLPSSPSAWLSEDLVLMATVAQAKDIYTEGVISVPPDSVP
ncbi:hypothetical protein ACFOD4_18880 [Pseudoroseomonas globiformis]|uniref:Uncharacterized protein n=1 Tax=Teichococcus globiformis TaxID=2307229 RepID=A0ABV7GAA6_9PROT